MSYNLVDSTTGALTRVAGRGKAEYGASSVRSGTYIPSSPVQAQEDLTFSVTFSEPMPDNDYQVIFGSSSYGDASGTIQCVVRGRSTTGFTGIIRNVGLNEVSVASGTFTWFAFKLYSDVEYSNIVNSMPSDASAGNKLVTTNAIYKTLTTYWDGAGNRFIKLSNAYSTARFKTNNYIVSCRNGETYLLVCGTTDGGDIVAPEVYLLYGGTGKLATNGFYYDSTTKEIAFMTQSYNAVSVTQISGEVADIVLSEVSATNPLSNPVKIAPLRFVTESDFNYKSGTVNFTCGANLWNTVDVNFDSPMPDADYVVTLESGNTGYVHVQNVTIKSTNGFTIIVWNRDELTADRPGIINWQAYKIPH